MLKLVHDPDGGESYMLDLETHSIRHSPTGLYVEYEVYAKMVDLLKKYNIDPETGEIEHFSNFDPVA